MPDHRPLSSRLVIAAPIAVLIATLGLGLAACGDTADPAADTPRPPPAPVLSEADKAAILATLPAPYDQGELENGRRAFARCRSCHTVTPGGPDMTGPNLWGVFGRAAGSHGRYNYSPALKQADFAWDAARLDDWLANPRTFLPGNKMTFPGLPDATDRRDLIAWLKVETGYAPAEAAPPTPATE